MGDGPAGGRGLVGDADLGVPIIPSLVSHPATFEVRESITNAGRVPELSFPQTLPVMALPQVP
jgi:hypothetical protein